MDASFKIWETNRQLYLKLINNYSLEQLNKIPEGFSNNLVWNLGHIIVAQQGLVYRLSGLPINVSDEMNEKYRNGSKPTGTTTQAELDELKMLLFSLLEQTKEDFAAGKFVTYNEYTTGTGFHLANIKDAIEFNNYHEGLHFGFMMNIRKFI
ncbi:DinB family protein [Flavobacterium sp. IMCC34852]|uniref:DinB family protein n=1 Tax=Flavobacterium rivulicola TaxID=2732161 RepID=A0A7Y3R7T2_9FLAO|nr:DinB family protein [Flavobacterium sp. IMCC34852]NNT71125.1 DinB family protein [Flavobacterium sp. IMCC34852]